MDFQVGEAQTARCARCGLPVRALGKASGRFCSPSCRAAAALFGDRHGLSLRALAGIAAVAASFLIGMFLHARRVGPEDAVPALWVEVALFAVAFACFGWPQWAVPNDEVRGMRHETVLALACAVVVLEGAWRLAHAQPASSFDPALVLLLAALADLLESEARAQAARTLGGLLEPLPALEAIKQGDRLKIGAGELVPVDATLAAGDALLSLLRVTGSAEPLVGAPGLKIPAGAVNVGAAIDVQAETDGKASGLSRLPRALSDLMLSVRELPAGPASLLANGDFLLLLAAAAALFWRLREDPHDAFERFLAVLAAGGGAGAFLAARELAAAIAARELAWAGFSGRSAGALREASESPVGDGAVPERGPLQPIRSSADWRRAVVSCRRFEYNMQSSPWLLVGWSLAGIALAATGALKPGMAAGFALLGAAVQTQRALSLSKPLPRRV